MDRMCIRCFALADSAGNPLSPQPPAPSESLGYDTSCVVLGRTVCKRCELRDGRVIEFSEGLAFLGRDGELFILVMDVGAGLLDAEIGRELRFDGVKQVVYAVNAETLERTEVER